MMFVEKTNGQMKWWILRRHEKNQNKFFNGNKTTFNPLLVYPKGKTLELFWNIDDGLPITLVYAFVSKNLINWYDLGAFPTSF
jgi:hypothetical protein